MNAVEIEEAISALAEETFDPQEFPRHIFAQCNNFLALRLTNNADQNYAARIGHFIYDDNSKPLSHGHST